MGRKVERMSKFKVKGIKKGSRKEGLWFILTTGCSGNTG
jgi:hypothetical protein